MNRKVRSMVGLAKRAGKAVSGEFSVENAVKCGKARLVIIAEDASDNTAKKFFNMCEYRHVPHIKTGTKDELGSCLGQETRACIAINDSGFANRILELASQEQA